MEDLILAVTFDTSFLRAPEIGKRGTELRIQKRLEISTPSRR